MVARLAEIDLAQVGVAFAPTSPDEFVDALCQAFEHMTGPGRASTTARLTLFMEAGHTPALRELLARPRASMEAVGTVALARLGARDPQAAATAIGACFEGHVVQRIALHDDTDPRPTFELVVRAALH
ncbi:hypothetical protein [Saccharothrix deserti]|uniref:hypothetical protein n=1 Tax=Saccharothrix deserti TaxID=2593674 RepID=UPI001EE3E924|nr:hypothetical protein [Saccharothrix deserti]